MTLSSFKIENAAVFRDGKFQGSFSCSDPRLDRLWQISAWTCQIAAFPNHDAWKCVGGRLLPRKLEAATGDGRYRIQSSVDGMLKVTYEFDANPHFPQGRFAVIAGGTVTSDANGANGVFCYGGNGGQNGASGDGATVMISDTVITTTGDGSGGIMTTGGGVTKATNLNVFTSGQSSAAIRTDRGGGAVTVDGGTYTTNGLGSPAIYSKADISAANASLVSNLSEGVVIEGKNSITLTNVDLTANNTQCYGNAAFLDTVLIYQSMSSDADRGTSRFAMTGGSLTNKNGHVFHVTNTNAVIDLCDVDGWRGADNIATLNASAQAISGAVLVGSDSTLALTLTDNSSFEGRIGGNIVDASGQTVSTEVGTAIVTLDSGSTWTLTGDSYITSFSGDAENVIGNGYTLYVNGTALCGTG